MLIGASPTNADRADEQSQAGPKVVCIKDYDPPTGAYQYQPHKCVLHERGAYPLASANTIQLKKMHWKRWQAGSAVGKGMTAISTYGPAPIEVKLLRARHPCGTTVFSKAKIRVTIHSDGETHHSHGKLSLDDCLS
jgi:hypothetical protein